MSLPARRRSPFGIPILLALVTVAGLVSALLGDGLWDALSWVALGTPAAACLALFVWPRKAPRR